MKQTAFNDLPSIDKRDFRKEWNERMAVQRAAEHQRLDQEEEDLKLQQRRKRLQDYRAELTLASPPKATNALDSEVERLEALADRQGRLVSARKQLEMLDKPYQQTMKANTSIMSPGFVDARPVKSPSRASLNPQASRDRRSTLGIPVF